MTKSYDRVFYERQRDGSKRSAREMVPEILRLVPASSVLDVGCGVGTWLSVFQEQGVKNITGVDGEYVQPEMLQIPGEYFVSRDLKQPLGIEGRFDLVMSLEVAEHLDEKLARRFVEGLVRRGDVVLFSAAIPLQGGRNHVNEQWPSYWMDIFASFGFVAVDCLRDLFWENELVEAHYIQNMFIYVSAERLDAWPGLKSVYECQSEQIQMKIHPRAWLNKVAKQQAKIDRFPGRRMEKWLRTLVRG